MDNHLKKIVVIWGGFIAIFFLGLMTGYFFKPDVTQETPALSQQSESDAEKVIQDFIQYYYTDNQSTDLKGLKPYVTNGYYQEMEENLEELKAEQYYHGSVKRKVKTTHIYLNPFRKEALVQVVCEVTYQNNKAQNAEPFTEEATQTVLLNYQYVNQKVKINNLTPMNLSTIKEGDTYGTQGGSTITD